MPTTTLLTRARLGAACAAAALMTAVAVPLVTAGQPAEAADPTGYQNVRINEVTSSGNDTVELYNAGSTTVSLSGWEMSDNTFSPQTFTPSSSSIAPGGFVTFNSPKGLGDADTLVVYTAGGTVVDRVDWATDEAKPAMARCGGDGTGAWVTATTATFGSANASGCPSTIPASSNVRINEVTSQGNDTVELYNAGSASVSISSWKYVDSDTTHAITKISSPSASSIPAGGYVTFNSSLGLGDNDSLFLMDANGNTIDSVTWATDAAEPSIQRCANGTGWFQTSTTATFGSANSCTGSLTGGGGTLTSKCAPSAPSNSGSAPSGAVAWPGGANVAITDNVCEFQTSLDPAGTDLSGLAFDPTNPSVLWAVSNDSWVFKLVKSGGLWVPDSSWSSKGKQIYFAGGTGEPDSEGITVGADGKLYVTSERDNDANTNPLDTIMEFDPTASGSTMTPIHEWNMTSQFPQLKAGNKDDANAGFEGVTYVPDSFLTADGWVDPNTGAAYNPSNYPLHGAGLFFAGLEDNGDVYVYGLNSDGSFTTFGSFASGNASLSDVTYDAGTQRVIVHCDNTCAVANTVMKISGGSFVKDLSYQRPAVLPDDNFEGFAVAPTSTCVSGSREAVWADDGIYGTGKGSAGYGHALYSGTLPCS